MVRRCRVAALLALAACGHPSSDHSDAATTTDDDAGMDGGLDATPDALMGTLSPEPTDQANPPCSGILGFPGVPALPFGGNQVLVADIDGDGRKDIITADGSALNIALGNGDGTFQAAQSQYLATNASAVRLTDMNGDGVVDLAYRVLTLAGVEVRIALNNGAGGFGAAQILTNVGSADQIELLDLDGNGKKDLVALATSSYAISVSLNNGTSFGTAQTYAAGPGQYVQHMAVGDVTGDGRPDVVATSTFNNTFSVLVNSGTGTFPTRVEYPGPSSVEGVLLADVNEDGHLDTILGSSSQGRQQMSVSLNSGTGKFGTATTFSINDGGAPYTLAAADVNGDGHLDVATSGPVTGTGAVLLGTGDGQFTVATQIANDPTFMIALADLQGDGRADLISMTPTLTSVYLNRGTAQPFEIRTLVPFHVPGGPGHGARAVNLDGDSLPDLISVGSNTSAVESVGVRLATGVGNYGAMQTYPSIAPFRTLLSDVNNDSRPDLLLFYREEQTLLNNGDGTLVPRTPLSFGAEARDVSLADIDQNGIRDLIVGFGDPDLAPYTGEVRMYPGLGTGNFGPAKQIWTGGGVFGVATPDLDHDGKRDVVINSYSNNAFHQDVLLATGNGAFAAPVVSTYTVLPTTYLSVHDLNHDGNDDLVGRVGYNLSVMLGTGSGTLGAPLDTQMVNGARAPVAFADIDGDGNLDVIASTMGTIVLLHGNGDGSFAAPVYYPAGANTEVTLADINGDGRIDVLVDQRGTPGDWVSILYGRCIQ